MATSAVHRLFLVTAGFKAIDGLLETAGGVVLLVTSPGQLRGWLGTLMQHDLSRDTHDALAHVVGAALHHLDDNAKLFAAVYLLGHGLAKVALVVALLRRVLWAYPTAAVIFGAFLVYQMYRYVIKPSPAMLVLSALDLIVIVLIWLEYRRVRSTSKTGA
jgi:uncharacterized membrane protein